MRLIASYIVGLVFGVGISLSGMANPAKVLNFFDIFGSWDPSLAFVMGSALIVTAIGYRFVLRANRPLLATRFLVPTRTDLDARLIGGSALFGVGWGIAGFCPGGALPALGTGTPAVFIFVAAVIAGIWIARALQRLTAPHAADV
ncbi:hypothetical protein SAMN05444004_11351 [Jannaschia faecimaris]|uniref:Sulphur transport domain-containing protein n=1 Tax=Jannaschia faecimaris TaxID=1244108 RepID=A0A1H3STQ9_9RHOB|nr:DUF6691 family protein [Jannaschia faecimaris]SDZ40509.1 hypothetical protein SAMN05444004_11351 [Jannaschia faecimaris]